MPCSVGPVSRVEPVYPIAARKRRIQGAVRLDTVIGKDGHVLNFTLIAGNSLLADAAKEALMQWVFRLTLLNGEPIVVVVEVCVPFILAESRHKTSPCGLTNRIRC